ncbi:MAG: copper resistance protein CopC [Rhodoglobus sp.]
MFPRLRRKREVVAALLLVVLGLGLLTSAPAQAHSYLIASTPEAGSTLSSVPESFSVTANEPLLDLAGASSGFAIEIVDKSGLYYGDGCVSITEATLETAASLGAPGEYRMLWQLVSADGHTVSGEIDFVWAPTTAQNVETAGAVTPPSCTGQGGTSAPPSMLPTSEPRYSAEFQDTLWIGAAIIAVLITGVAALYLTRRYRRNPSD